MLFGETVAVYCENHTEHTDIYKLSSYLTGDTWRLRYKAQPVNVVWGNSRCLLWEPYGTHREHCVGRIQGFNMLKEVVHIVTTGL
jgi:hypothetical protein